MLARGSSRYVIPVLIVAFLLVAVAAWTTHLVALLVAVVGLVLALFVVWFFRDPERTPGAHVTSPADGRVLSVSQDERELRINVFMPPWGVHVNRSPLEGRIEQLEHRLGAHLPAFKKESDANERVDVDLSTAHGPVRVSLIAGTVARRIHPYVAPGAEVKKGDRIGLIAFGSRCVLVLPGPGFRPEVGPGDWVRAGETTVARKE